MQWWLMATALADTIPNATLSIETEMYAIIDDDGYGGATEVISFSGEGTLTIEGSTTITLNSGEESAALDPGTYKLTLSDYQEEDWDISVYKQYSSNPREGRIYSRNWKILSPNGSFNQIFYAVIPQYRGAAAFEVVGIEVSGLISKDTTETIEIFANQQSTTENPFTSLPPSGYLPPDPDHQLYLTVPEESTASEEAQSLSSTAAYSAKGICTQTVIPDNICLTTDVSSALPGLAVFGCDANRSGELDWSGFEDLLIISETTTGDWTQNWYGDTLDGVALDPGEYRCEMGVFNSTIAATVFNAETANPGVRLFVYDPTTEALSSLNQHWNDERPISADSDSTLDTVDFPPYTVGTAGVPSQEVLITANGLENAHAWVSYGDSSWIVTWAALDAVFDSTFSVTVKDSTLDSDGDLLIDGIEECLTETPPDDPDADQDTLTDGEEIENVNDPRDLDSDGLIDALDSDDDGDDLQTEREVADAAVYGDDVDADGMSNWYDADSDGDGIPDGQEADDSDGDGMPDYLQFSNTPDTGQPDDTMTTAGLLTGGGCSGEMLWLFGLGGLLTGWRVRARRE